MNLVSLEAQLHYLPPWTALESGSVVDQLKLEVTVEIGDVCSQDSDDEVMRPSLVSGIVMQVVRVGRFAS